TVIQGVRAGARRYPTAFRVGALCLYRFAATPTPPGGRDVCIGGQCAGDRPGGRLDGRYRPGFTPLQQLLAGTPVDAFEIAAARFGFMANDLDHSATRR
ncbi:hypothetical protein, partial [Nocardia cyriacigeorgica]|uniref:hypothetical protein n=1 Tax=Nocardia cyriacigeorgica TaxID=135487 RepID=UPI002456D120